MRSCCLSVLLLPSPARYTKRTVHIRTVRFSLQAGCKKTVFPAKENLPRSCLLFLFFKKRNRPPSFLFRRKEAKENQMRSSWLSVLLLPSPTRYTKRTVHIRSVRFSLQAGCKKTVFPAKENLPRSCLLFLFFKKRNRFPPFFFRRKEIVPPMTCSSFALVHASRVLRRSSSAETADSPPL